MSKTKTMTAAMPSIQVTSDSVVDRRNNHDIRRLAGPKFGPDGRFIETLEWFLVDGIPGKHLTLDEAIRSATSC